MQQAPELENSWKNAGLCCAEDRVRSWGGSLVLLRATAGTCNACLQITNVFCCGTLIKLLFPAGALWCCEWSGAQPSPFRCKSALCSLLIIALHPALGFQRHPGNRVCSACNLDCTLFVITLATRYNFSVLFKFYEFQRVSHVPVGCREAEPARGSTTVPVPAELEKPGLDSMSPF